MRRLAAAVVLICVGGLVGIPPDAGAATPRRAAAPVVSRVSPAAGPAIGGTRVTVRGTGFTRRSVVLIGQQRARTTFVSARRLVAVAPSGVPGRTAVRVRTGRATSKATRKTRFTYQSMLTPVVTLRASGPTEVSIGDTLAFVGSTATARAGSAVRLEYQNGDARWLTAAAGSVGKDGTFSLRHQPLAGAWRYRAVVAAGGRYRAGTSRSVVVDVSGPAQVQVEVVNVPAGATPVVVVSGPDGDRTISGSTTYTPARPGSWRVVADAIPDEGGDWSALVPDQTTELARGQSTTFFVDYSLRQAPDAVAPPTEIHYAAERVEAGLFDLTFPVPSVAARRRLDRTLSTDVGRLVDTPDTWWLPRSCPQVGDKIALPPSPAIAELYRGALGTITDIDCLLWGVDFRTVVRSIRLRVDGSVTFADLVQHGTIDPGLRRLVLDGADATTDDGYLAPVLSEEIKQRATGTAKVEAATKRFKVGCTGTVGAELAADLDLTPQVELNAEWGLFKLTKATLRGEITERASMAATLEGQGTCSGTFDLGTLHFPPFVVPAGPFALTVLPRLETTASADVGFTASASIGVEQRFSTWAEVAWAPQSGFTTGFGGDPATLTPTHHFNGALTGSLKLRAELSFNLVGVDGPYLYAQAKVDAKALADVDPSADTGWEVRPSVSLGGRFRLKALGVGIESDDLPFWTKEWGPYGTLGRQPATDVVDVSAGNGHFCAVRSNGTVWCWGTGSRGELGNGATTASDDAVQVTGLDDAVSVAAGASYSCAVRRSGSVVCWGAGRKGELGNGATTDSVTPVAVLGIDDAVSVDAGGGHTCAVLGSGAVRCWGAGSAGQLGNGSTQSSATPVAVSGLTDAVQVSVAAPGSSSSEAHTCAVRTGGGVVCWGHNGDGQLGDGTQDPSAVPRAVVGLSDAVEVAAGGMHTCARRANGTAACWGYLRAAQVLPSTFTSSSATPVAVAGLSDVVDLHNGWAGTVALGAGRHWGSWIGVSKATWRSGSAPEGGVRIETLDTVGDWQTCVLTSTHRVECLAASGSDKWTPLLVP